MKQTSNNEVLQSVGMFLRPTLEINPKHEIILSLNKLKDSNKDIAELLLHQLYGNAMITAGLMDDPREMVGRLNQLLTEFGKQLTSEVSEEDDTIVIEDDGQK
jgi:HSP90 family molecular chaperone